MLLFLKQIREKERRNKVLGVMLHCCDKLIGEVDVKGLERCQTVNITGNIFCSFGDKQWCYSSLEILKPPNVHQVVLRLLALNQHLLSIRTL
jgi:hypothetical protein